MWEIIAGPLFKIIDKLIPDPAAAAQMKLETLKLQQNGELAEIESAVKVITAEASSTNPLASGWRPILMLTFTAIIANNYILAPYLQAMFHVGLTLPLPADLWDLLKLGVGGYVVGRSAEKVATTLKGAA